MIIEGTVLPVDRANVDTDQIIPARHLTGITKTGLGQYLFDGLPGGAELLAAHAGAAVVVTRENFGCGSSREHAAWALVDRGYRAIIAPSFARIFLENAYNNAVVPVVLQPVEVEACMTSPSLRIDVEGQRVRLPDGTEFSFELDELRKQFILGGGFMRYLASKVETVRAWEIARLS